MLRSSRNSNILQALAVVLSLCWIAWIILDYFQKHSLYQIALGTNSYWLPIGTSLLGSIALYYILGRVDTSSLKLKPNGLILLIMSTLVVWWLLAISRNAILDDFPDLELSTSMMIGTFLFSILRALVVLLSCFAMGTKTLQFTKLKLPRLLHRCCALALGFLLFYFFLFILGSFGLLYWFTIVPVLLVGIGLAWRDVLSVLFDIFIKPLSLDKNTERYGTLAFTIITLVLYIGLLQSVTIYPKGFDALNFYANIPNLIAEKHALVYGFRPYAWSLIQSTGHIVFGSIEVSNLLSSSAGIFICLITYFIGTKQLGFPSGQTLLAICAFVTIPAFTTQLSHELKIDLPLLFIQLVCLSLTLHYLKKDESSRLFIVLALLLGLCLAIKITSFLLIFGILVAFWYRAGKTSLPMAMFCFILAAILLFRIDRFSGLDHLIGGRAVYAVLLIIVGLGVGVNHALAHRHYIWDRTKKSITLVLIASAMYLPWMAKNATDCGTLSFECVLSGAPSNLEFDMKQMNQIYQESKAEQQ